MLSYFLLFLFDHIMQRRTTDVPIRITPSLIKIQNRQLHQFRALPHHAHAHIRDWRHYRFKFSLNPRQLRLQQCRQRSRLLRCLCLRLRSRPRSSILTRRRASSPARRLALAFPVHLNECSGLRPGFPENLPRTSCWRCRSRGEGAAAGVGITGVGVGGCGRVRAG